MRKLKNEKQMERHLKGIANHYRIAILLTVGTFEGITLDKLVELVKGNTKTIGEHTRRLVSAGLINKKYKGKFVEHRLSPYGKLFVKFIKSFQRS